MKPSRSVSPQAVEDDDDCWYDARDLMRLLLERGGMTHADALGVTDRIESRRDINTAVAATHRAFVLVPFFPTVRSRC